MLRAKSETRPPEAETRLYYFVFTRTLDPFIFTSARIHGQRKIRLFCCLHIHLSPEMVTVENIQTVTFLETKIR